jgi:hypothetical protein
MGPRGKRPQRGDGRMGLPLTRDEIELKREIKGLIKKREVVPGTLRAAWRAAVKRAKRQQLSNHKQHMKTWLYEHPRLFWQSYRSVNADTATASGTFTTEQWQRHFSEYFRVNPDRTPVEASPGNKLDENIPLLSSITKEEVLAAYKQLGTGKSVGTDDMPAEFFTKSHVERYPGVQVVDVVVEMFNQILRTGVMPTSWKVKQIVPLYKKGGREKMGNYRPIAISTTLARLFASIYATRLSDFMESDPTVKPLMDAQFGFRRRLSTDHAHLLLRTCCDLALAIDEPIALVKLDISKAYDRVDRDTLWEVMRRMRYPEGFISLMQELYREVPYVVKINGERSMQFVPDLGMPQGLATSPKQFNDYVLEVIEAVEEACKAVGCVFLTADCEEQPVTNAAFADDIKGAVLLGGVQLFLDTVKAALTAKGLTLSEEKCEIVIISKTPTHLTDIAGLPVVGETKSLGLLYTSKMDQTVNFADRLKKGASKNVLHYSRLKRTGCDREFQVARLMTQVDVIPTMLFGACMWGYVGLNSGGHMDHKMQRVCSVLPRHSLGLPVSTANWIVCMMAGLMPIRDTIVLTFARFWNKALALCGENKLVKAALEQQAMLFTENKKCWMRCWAMALNGALESDYLSEVLSSVQEIDMPLLESHLLNVRLGALGALGDPFSSAPCRHRKMAFTHHVLGVNRVWGQVPQVIKLRAPPGCKKKWIRFLAAWGDVPTQDLAVISRSSFHTRICTHCDMGAVANEHHILLDCPVTAPVRTTFAGRIRFTTTLTTMMTCNSHNEELPDFVIECLTLYRSATALLAIGL